MGWKDRIDGVGVLSLNQDFPSALRPLWAPRGERMAEKRRCGCKNWKELFEEVA